MTGYLDNNIIVKIENGLLQVTDLINRIDSNLTDFFYSAAHIFEAKEINNTDDKIRDQWIQKRLKTIESITDCNYLYQELPSNKVISVKANPEAVLNTIEDVPFVDSMMKSVSNFIGEKKRIQIRQALDLEVKYLNNYKPNEVIEHLNKKLFNWGKEVSFIELIENGIKLQPQGKEFGLHYRIGMIFELLDMLGYWTDKYNEKSNYARLWDSNHTFFASFCNYFISDDKRTRNKAKVVYEIYGIGTIVKSSKGE